jgi:hypothetical protein
MDTSTKNVTLYAVFINDILKLYEDKKDQFAAPLFQMTREYNLMNPYNKVPIQLYNYMCSWLEEKLGPANLKKVGLQIGETVYDALIKSGNFPAQPKPLEIINGLVHVASQMIQDPKGRGWVVLKHTSHSITIRRTQTFNSTLQLGLLRGLVQKTGVKMVEVKYAASVAEGAPYDDYLITWI